MDIDATNIDNYVITNNMGKSFCLYNKSTDKAFFISKEEYDYIYKRKTKDSCFDVETWAIKRNGKL